MKYKFREAQFGPDFRKDDIVQIKELIDRSITFSVAGMPGVGVSVFLRYLACQNFAYFIYVDAYTLSEISKLEFYQLLYQELGGVKKFKNEQEVLAGCRQFLQDLVLKNERVVIILNRFDQLKKIFDNQLFADLIALRNVKNEQIVFIFTGNKPYVEILPEDISGDKVNLFTKTFYLKPYSEADLGKLLKISAQTSVHTADFIQKALKLCGGHFQLLQLFLKSERLDPPFIDRYVRFQLKELYDFLNYHQKKQVEQIAFGKKTTHPDPYLTDIGIINNQGQLFTPLLSDYIRTNVPVKLPVKEKALFDLLKKHLNTIITKDQIFNHVWILNPEEASDWALNALIYRLKKNPGFISSGFILESHKKIGYKMLKQ